MDKTKAIPIAGDTSCKLGSIETVTYLMHKMKEYGFSLGYKRLKINSHCEKEIKGL
jgi:pentatricopeptide repeat protein